MRVQINGLISGDLVSALVDKKWTVSVTEPGFADFEEIVPESVPGDPPTAEPEAPEPVGTTETAEEEKARIDAMADKLLNG